VETVLGWLSDEEKEKVRKTNLADLHFGLGMAIRNEFGLWQG
jgi:hypothetical protein